MAGARTSSATTPCTRSPTAGRRAARGRRWIRAVEHQRHRPHVQAWLRTAAATAGPRRAASVARLRPRTRATLSGRAPAEALPGPPVRPPRHLLRERAGTGQRQQQHDLSGARGPRGHRRRARSRGPAGRPLSARAPGEGHGGGRGGAEMGRRTREAERGTE